MDNSNEKIYSLVGTGVFHALIIIALLFCYLQPTFDKRTAEELEGVPVMFGNVPDAFGDDEPFGRGDGLSQDQNVVPPNTVEVEIPAETKPREKTPATTAKNSDTKNINTQDFEETVAIKADVEKKKKAEADKKKKEEEAAAEVKRKQNEAAQIAKIEADKKKQISSQMSGLFGNGTGSGSRGNTHGTGTQGVPTGNASYGKTTGVGGWGSYDLGGRSVGSGGLAQPSYSVDDYGTVVIDIIVDPKGNVVEATIGRGTNTASATLKSEALRAARRTKFNTVSSLSNQKGTITYKFNLN